jgi:hypothetical protein
VFPNESVLQRVVLPSDRRMVVLPKVSVVTRLDVPSE